MNRRELLTATLAAGAAALSGESLATSMMSADKKAHWIELRRYSFRDKAQRDRYEAYLAGALVPALNRLQHTPVGVFLPADEAAAQELYLLIPHHSPEEAASLNSRLDRDADYRTTGQSVLSLHASDPPYSRIESWLLASFAGYPGVHAPKEAAERFGRTFELRTYESHNETAGLKKIEMFNSGEIDIFVRGEFQPVFFGQTLIGSGQPSLTYMVTYREGVARDVYWGRFSSDPETKRMFAKPEYNDREIVSHIQASMLRPAACSQI